MRTFFHLLTCLVVGGAFFALTTSNAQAATYTVCGSGAICDFTSVSAAFMGGTPGGDTFQVLGGGAAPYNPATESFPINFPLVGATVECTGGATIGQTNPSGINNIYFQPNSTLQNCNLSNVFLGTTGLPPNLVRILNNTFDTNATSTIGFSGGASNFTVQGNSHIAEMWIQGTSTVGVISDNTFENSDRNLGGGQIFTTSVSTSEVIISGNTFSNNLSSYGSPGFLNVSGENITFATNTVRYPTRITSGSAMYSVGFTASGTHNYIGGNFIDVPDGLSSNCAAIAVTPAQGTSFWNSVINIAHNTFRITGNCTNGQGLQYNDRFSPVTTNVNLKIYYNLTDNQTTSTISGTALEVESGDSNIFSIEHDYNGAYRYTDILETHINGEARGFAVETNKKLTNPFLRSKNASTADDQLTAPFSDYLDVNGTQDIGATSLTRRHDIAIDDTGTIDYSTVDATTTADIPDFLRSGDHVTLAAGTYDGFSVGSSAATSSITIEGAGATTIINAKANENGLTFTNVSSSAVQNLVIRNASTLGATTYQGTVINGRLGAVPYNDPLPPLGVPANSTLVFYNASNCDDNGSLVTDGDDITVATYGGTSGFHLVLLDIMGSHLTALMSSSQFTSNPATIESFFSDACGVPATVDGVADSIFTVSGGTYTYDSSSLVSSGIAYTVGTTNPPAISSSALSYAALKLAGSTNNLTISHVTGTTSGHGIWFAGSANNNTISDSTFESNTLGDIRSTNNATNTFDNTSFTRTSNSIEGTSEVLVKFDLRGETRRDGSELPIAGITMNATDGLGETTSLGTTDGSGFTSYVSLPAYVLTHDSSALTNGHYNNYTVETGVSGGYGASSTIVTLASINHTETLHLISTDPPSAPSSPVISGIGTTTGTFSWTDNADNELNFTVDLINISTGESFPGTSASVAANATSYALTGLIPNQEYRARVRADGLSGSSAYATTTIFRTLAAQPSAPTVTALSQTTVAVGVNAGSNSTSTEFSVFNSTLGTYIDGAGSPSTLAVWQTTTTWGTSVTVSSLTCATAYSFVVDARNGDHVVSATSTAGSVTTNACPVVVSSGGGGGGGGGGSISPLQTIFDQPRLPTSTINTPVIILPPPAPIPGQTPAPNSIQLPPEPASPATPASRAIILGNAQTSNIQLTEQQQEALAAFIDHGADPATTQLGAGERQAIIRDLFDTLHRSPTIEDLVRNANGQIPNSRNLTQERLQLPRVRQTFRTLYHHDPNFQNQEENLAWNTLMYRIRFPRNLTAERTGITEYRQLFHRNPQDPFQWATVRALGYVQQ